MPRTSTSAPFNAAAIRRPLMRWYRGQGRHALPWRLTRDPYAILISEVMLQQTQVDRVIPYYQAWLERWPDFTSLAAAPPSEVIRAWRGLGYNRRALNLHRLAVLVSELPDAALPPTLSALMRLPGVGPYTASAIECFARDETLVVADTNIARVVSRVLLGAPNQREVPPRTLAQALESLLPTTYGRDHNLALMDLGALVCSARAPRCDGCPIRDDCRWRLEGYVASETSRTPLPKFETTARFARGRIIDALRESPMTAEELRRMLPSDHRPLIADYLAGLAREGLVQETNGIWTLPV
ncbi:MAG: A/G-specific adenine glycosylase [bacterium]